MCTRICDFFFFVQEQEKVVSSAQKVKESEQEKHWKQMQALRQQQQVTQQQIHDPRMQCRHFSEHFICNRKFSVYIKKLMTHIRFEIQFSTILFVLNIFLGSFLSSQIELFWEKVKTGLAFTAF